MFYKIYFYNIRQIIDPLKFPETLKNIPDWRKIKILKYKNEDDRKRSIGAWKIISRILKDNNIDSSDLYSSNRGKLKSRKINFNISHSKNLVVGVTSNLKIGCDIEKVVNTPFKIMDRIFTENEVNFVNSGKDLDERSQNFFRIWTAKESYLKMTGEGIIKDLKSLEVDPIRKKIKRNGIEEACDLFFISLKNYELTICSLK